MGNVVGRGVVAIVAVIASVALALPPQAVAAPVSIVSARGATLGSVVTVSGTVSTPSGAFESSFNDQGFAIQDRTGGIYISAAGTPDLALATVVTVTGTLADQSGLLVVEPTSITATGSSGFVVAQPVITRGVDENTEGRLVTAVGRVIAPVQDDFPYGHEFVIDDFTGGTTVFLNTQTGIDPAIVKAGSIVQITGFSSQHTDHYEIDPRFPSDVRVFWR